MPDIADNEGRLDSVPEQKGGSGGRPGRGHLRIYLGSAAGVGKSYAMLGEGHRRAERGADVVVAFAEAHGRRLTAGLVDGLEMIPRRVMEYRGATFEEMDLDAVLARRPEIALVDEFAHTNVPGSRNEKRWQDVEELLDVLPPLLVAGPRDVGVCELVDQRDLRPPGEHRVQVHLLEG